MRQGICSIQQYGHICKRNRHLGQPPFTSIDAGFLPQFDGLLIFESLGNMSVSVGPNPKKPSLHTADLLRMAFCEFGHKNNRAEDGCSLS